MSYYHGLYFQGDPYIYDISNTAASILAEMYRDSCQRLRNQQMNRYRSDEFNNSSSDNSDSSGYSHHHHKGEPNTPKTMPLTKIKNYGSKKKSPAISRNGNNKTSTKNGNKKRKRGHSSDAKAYTKRELKYLLYLKTCEEYKNATWAVIANMFNEENAKKKLRLRTAGSLRHRYYRSVSENGGDLSAIQRGRGRSRKSAKTINNPTINNNNHITTTTIQEEKNETILKVDTNQSSSSSSIHNIENSTVGGDEQNIMKTVDIPPVTISSSSTSTTTTNMNIIKETNNESSNDIVMK